MLARSIEAVLTRMHGHPCRAFARSTGPCGLLSCRRATWRQACPRQSPNATFMADCRGASDAAEPHHAECTQIGSKRCETLVRGRVLPVKDRQNKGVPMRVDVDATRAYYRAPSVEPCDCAYCDEYRAKIAQAYPRLVAELEAIGVDAANPFELSLPDYNRDGKLEYGFAQYIVMGEWAENETRMLGVHQVSSASSHPSTGIGEPHFVMQTFGLAFDSDIEA